MRNPKQLHVAVGVIINPSGQVLISKRAENAHQGGLWEFPGGKLEAGEDIAQALAREIKEELDISVESAFPLIKIKHAYYDRNVLLDVWKVTRFSGKTKGLEGQPWRWVLPDELSVYLFPEANYPIITAIKLSEFYPFLEDSRGNVTQLKANFERMIRNGIKLIRLRAIRLKDTEYKKLAIEICQKAASLGVAVLVHGGPELVVETNAAGLHLNSKELMDLRTRPINRDYWLAASCHNLNEVNHAEAVGVDFVVLSPVLPTPSHTNIKPIGWGNFEALVSKSNLPVYALGGLKRSHLDEAKFHGAQGISGISGFLES